jgi:hypothetical protein
MNHHHFLNFLIVQIKAVISQTSAPSKQSQVHSLPGPETKLLTADGHEVEQPAVFAHFPLPYGSPNITGPSLYGLSPQENEKATKIVYLAGST